ncbi:MAG: RDD family protein [Acidobacteriaceae bacterium]|nr:RDD family protein [Acidobacteriaceae bacterium]
MGSALLDTTALDPAFAEETSRAAAATSRSYVANSAIAPAASGEALRRQAAERLAAHRNRRNQAQAAPAHPPTSSRSQAAPSRSSRIAAAVAQRYANTPSYHAFLAAEAERATQQARAAAEIAERNAQAVARAQQELLVSLQQEALAQQAHIQAARDQELAEQAHYQQQEISEQALRAQQSPAQTDLQNAVPQEFTLRPAAQPARSRFQPTEPSRPAAQTVPAQPAHTKFQPPSGAAPVVTVRLYEDEASAAHVDLSTPLRLPSISQRNQSADRSDAEARALDEEIAFRQSPVFEESVGPAALLPANLIEFPRQLVAPRKARPRYAEGPLRDEEASVPGESQLRIFEVDPRQISTTPNVADSAFELATQQWTSIWLDADHASSSVADSAFPPEDSSFSIREDDLQNDLFVPQPTSVAPSLPGIASIQRRLTAASIDASLLGAGFLAFAATSIAVASRFLPAAPAQPSASLSLSLSHAAQLSNQIASQTGLQLSAILGASALIFAALFLAYQTLFYSLSDATPGMRLARIALCTFDDENPTRRARHRRICAVLLSACPFGLGLLWATLDEDRLSWHDRISATYQRSY